MARVSTVNAIVVPACTLIATGRDVDLLPRDPVALPALLEQRRAQGRQTFDRPVPEWGERMRTTAYPPTHA